MKRIILPNILLILSICLATFFWDKIIINTNDLSKVYLAYPGKNYHILNDIIRFIFFVSFPLLTYFLSFYFFANGSRTKISELIFFKDIKKKKNSNLIIWLLGIFIFLTILNFLSLDFLNIHKNLDHLHEGVVLTPSNNFFMSSGIWKSSFTEYGFINFDAALIWSLFNIESIGSAKFIKFFYLLVNKILLILIIFKVSSNLNINNFSKIIFFSLVSLFSVFLVDYYDGDASEIPPRLLVLLFFFLIFFFIIESKKINFFTIYLFGFTAGISIFWSLDVGIYINVLFLLINIFFLLRKEYKKIFNVLIAYFTTYLIVFLYLGTVELNYLKESFTIVLENNDRAMGLILNTPFLSGDARATRFLLAYLVSGVFLIKILFDKKYLLSNPIKIFFLFLFIASIFISKQALARSDTGHFKAASGFNYLIISSCFFYFTLFLLEKKFFYIKEFNNNKKKLLFFIFSGCLAVSFFLISGFQNLNNNEVFYKQLTTKKSFQNIFYFRENIKNYFLKPDEEYSSNEFNNFINIYKNLSKNDKCVQTLTNIASIPYLLKKPTCTRFFTNIYLLNDKAQNDYIRSLEKEKVRLILFSSEQDRYGDIVRQRMPLVFKYLQKNYKVYDTNLKQATHGLRNYNSMQPSKGKYKFLIRQ
jgi:hypothetical protein